MPDKRASPQLEAILTDCRLEAEEAEKQLHKIAECLRTGKPLGAVAASEEFGERVQYVIAVLKRTVRLITARTRGRERARK